MSAPSNLTPVGAVVRGLLAGVVGTAAMTAWQELYSRLMSSGSGSDPAPAGAAGAPADPWEQASAPAKVAKRISEGVFERPVSPDSIPLLTNVTHWGYGTGWGAVLGIVGGSLAERPAVRFGALFGTGVWVMSYVQLVPMGLYELPWKYSVSDLASELSFHLVYGVGAGLAFSALDRR